MPPESLVGVRPSKPDPRLLDRATIALEQRFGIALSSGWVIDGRMERRASTIMRMTGRSDGKAVVIFYKAVYVPPSLDADKRLESIRRYRTVWTREWEFSTSLHEKLVGERILFDEPLALDIEQLHGLRLGVPGRELGKGIVALLPPNRAAPRELYTSIGRGLRSLDVFGVSRQMPLADQLKPRLTSETVAGRLRSDLNRLQPRMLASTYECAVRLVSQLETSEQGQRPLVVVHRDMSPSNILVEWPQLGFVDFTWEPDVRHRDLVQFLTRVSLTRPYVRGWWSVVADWVIDGYCLGAEDALDWNAALLQRAIKSSWTHHPRVHDWGLNTLVRLERSGMDCEVGFPLY